MPDFTVRQYGTDSSGRPIYATAYMWGVWEQVVDALGFGPVVTQGAWMSRVPGGGADNSAGYHDGGGCFDLRVWDRTQAERVEMVRVLREHGCAAWRRYKSQGMDEDHLHFVLGSDHGLTTGAESQWRDYLNGRDGLASHGPDYEVRPSPLVLVPPEGDDMPKYRDWDSEDKKALAKDVVDTLMAYKPGKDDDTLKQIFNRLSTEQERR